MRLAGVGYRARRHALLEVGDEQALADAGAAAGMARAIAGAGGQGRLGRAAPGRAPGGWAFQYANPHYPDLDDTAVVVMAMHRAQALKPDGYAQAIDRGREWVAGLQSHNGG